MSIVTIDAGDATPLYAQLERGLRAAIAIGRLRPGHQLPTVRQLAVDLSVNANTVARVYAELERAGVIETRRGVGSFISAAAPRTESRGEGDRRLRAFVTRVLADADANGFTIDDIRRELDRIDIAPAPSARAGTNGGAAERRARSAGDR